MENIDVAELKERLDKGEKIYLIDVRQPEEIAAYNIGGIALPLGKIQSMQTEDIEPLKEKEVVCYCRSGIRSMMAAVVLEQLGFHNVKNLAGGMEAYRELEDN